MDRLELVVGPDDVDSVSGMLWGAGISGIEERREPDGEVRLLIAVESDRVEEALVVLADRWDVRRSTMPADDAFVDAWRPHARATRIGTHLVIQPPWCEQIGGPGDTVVSLDPLRAWGHGGHPTTVLVAEILVGAPLDGAAVLDVGCGSGVLSLVALAGGAASVVALDIESDAVAATLANATVNGVDDRIVVSDAPLALNRDTFDWVLANIGAETIVSMAGHLVEAVAPAGHLVLSGLLEEQADAVVAAFGDLDEITRPTREGWAAPVLRRPETSDRQGIRAVQPV